MLAHSHRRTYPWLQSLLNENGEIAQFVGHLMHQYRLSATQMHNIHAGAHSRGHALTHAGAHAHADGHTRKQASTHARTHACGQRYELLQPFASLGCVHHEKSCVPVRTSVVVAPSVSEPINDAAIASPFRDSECMHALERTCTTMKKFAHPHTRRP